MIRRLDVKFVLTLILTAAIPMGVSIHFVAEAVQTSLRIGLNQDIADNLKQNVQTHRNYIQTIKHGHQLFLQRLKDSRVLFTAGQTQDKNAITTTLEKFLSEEKTVKRITLRNPNGVEIAVNKVPGPYQRPYRTVVKSIPVAVGEFNRAEILFAVDRSITENFEKAGTDMATYKALFEAPRDYLSNRVMLVYGLILGTILIISIWQGVFLTRRLARRIHTLSLATQKVAKGDLSVRVDTGAMDEVGELIVSFNRMVAEISSTRARIEYLQKISAWQEIARRLAHEIKNPLTPIHLAAQQLRTKYEGDEGPFKRLLEQSTEIIEEEVITLRRLVSDFSSFAKLPQVSPENTDLDTFLKECESSLSHLGGQNNITMIWETPKESMTISIDSMMMKRVIDNLVRNASEALIHSGIDNPTIKISTTKRTKNNRRDVVIKIEDNGPGIMPEHHPSIFEPYFTTKDEGTGLGLAISKKIVLEHGGKIWVDETYDQGAAFIVVLPLLS